MLPHLPEELIILILSYVDVKSLLKCRLVCKNWDELITSTRSKLMWKEKCRRLNIKHTPNGIPWFAYYGLMTNTFDRNLLLNNCGRQKFKHWRIESNGGNKFKTENPPVGTDPLPNQPEFDGCTSCFVTSYSDCSKYQKIKLTKLQKKIMDELKPEVYISEWYAGRFDCGCVYKLSVWFFDEHKNVLHEEVYEKTIEEHERSTWNKVEIKCTDYPKGVHEISFSHYGRDTQFWAGHYGSKFTGGVVKIVWDSIKSRKENNSYICIL